MGEKYTDFSPNKAKKPKLFEVKNTDQFLFYLNQQKINKMNITYKKKTVLNRSLQFENRQPLKVMKSREGNAFTRNTIELPTKNSISITNDRRNTFTDPSQLRQHPLGQCGQITVRSSSIKPIWSPHRTLFSFFCFPKRRTKTPVFFFPVSGKKNTRVQKKNFSKKKEKVVGKSRFPHRPLREVVGKSRFPHRPLRDQKFFSQRPRLKVTPPLFSSLYKHQEEKKKSGIWTNSLFSSQLKLIVDFFFSLGFKLKEKKNKNKWQWIYYSGFKKKKIKIKNLKPWIFSDFSTLIQYLLDLDKTIKKDKSKSSPVPYFLRNRGKTKQWLEEKQNRKGDKRSDKYFEEKSFASSSYKNYKNKNYYACISQITNWGCDEDAWGKFLLYMRPNFFKGDLLLPYAEKKTNFKVFPRTGGIMLEYLLASIGNSFLDDKNVVHKQTSFPNDFSTNFSENTSHVLTENQFKKNKVLKIHRKKIFKSQEKIFEISERISSVKFGNYLNWYQLNHFLSNLDIRILKFIYSLIISCKQKTFVTSWPGEGTLGNPMQSILFSYQTNPFLTFSDKISLFSDDPRLNLNSIPKKLSSNEIKSSIQNKLFQKKVEKKIFLRKKTKISTIYYKITFADFSLVSKSLFGKQSLVSDNKTGIEIKKYRRLYPIRKRIGYDGSNFKKSNFYFPIINFASLDSVLNFGDETGHLKLINAKKFLQGKTIKNNFNQEIIIEWTINKKNKIKIYNILISEFFTIFNQDNITENNFLKNDPLKLFSESFNDKIVHPILFSETMDQQELVDKINQNQLDKRILISSFYKNFDWWVPVVFNSQANWTRQEVVAKSRFLHRPLRMQSTQNLVTPQNSRYHYKFYRKLNQQFLYLKPLLRPALRQNIGKAEQGKKNFWSQLSNNSTLFVSSLNNMKSDWKVNFRVSSLKKLSINKNPHQFGFVDLNNREKKHTDFLQGKNLFIKFKEIGDYIKQLKKKKSALKTLILKMDSLLQPLTISENFAFLSLNPIYNVESTTRNLFFERYEHKKYVMASHRSIKRSLMPITPNSSVVANSQANWTRREQFNKSKNFYIHSSKTVNLLKFLFIWSFLSIKLLKNQKISLFSIGTTQFCTESFFWKSAEKNLKEETNIFPNFWKMALYSLSSQPYQVSERPVKKIDKMQLKEIFTAPVVSNSFANWARGERTQQLKKIQPSKLPSLTFETSQKLQETTHWSYSIGKLIQIDKSDPKNQKNAQLRKYILEMLIKKKIFIHPIYFQLEPSYSSSYEYFQKSNFPNLIRKKTNEKQIKNTILSNYMIRSLFTGWTKIYAGKKGAYPEHPQNWPWGANKDSKIYSHIKNVFLFTYGLSKRRPVIFRWLPKKQIIFAKNFKYFIQKLGPTQKKSNKLNSFFYLSKKNFAPVVWAWSSAIRGRPDYKK